MEITKIAQSVYSNELYDLLKKHEAYKRAAYADTKHIPHIGIGFNIGK